MRQALLEILLASFSLAGIGAAVAHEVKAHDLVIHHPWVRETPKGASVTAGYAKITNTGSAADKLIGATLSKAGEGELHESVVEEGISKMRALSDGLAIAPGQTVELAPGGVHLMFLNLNAPLAADGYVDGELIFEKAGKVAVEFYVEALGKQGEPGEDAAHKH